MQIITTIIPIFIVIAIGWATRKKGFFPPECLSPANRLAYYLAIPAMIFSSISKGSISHHFSGIGLFITLGSAAMAYAIAWVVSRHLRMPGARAGSFIQSAGHGNLGYIGLPVALYLLGDKGLVQASIIAGFLMILQNVLSVFFLQTQAAKGGDSQVGLNDIMGKLFGNPVILSAMAGILFSVLRIPIPQMVQRSLDMLGGLAPPLALLLIGASLSIAGIRRHFRSAMGAVFIKLVILPGTGLLLYAYFGMTAADCLPGLILMACPTATVAYVMSKQMNADAEFSAAAISAGTLFSAGTFSLWLVLIDHLMPPV